MAHPEVFETGQIPLLHFLFEVVGDVALRELFTSVSREELQTICEEFDAVWYAYSYPDVEEFGLDAFIHYMTIGWRERRDPSPNFSTSAYLLRYPDVANHGMNPFRHWVLYGQAEKRTGTSSSINFRNRPYAPSIAAILANSEKEPLSVDRLKAVVDQSLDDLTVFVLGSPLSDAHRSVLDGLGSNGRTVHHVSSDGPAIGWRDVGRAAEQITSDLIWFVQGPGKPDGEFVARLASSFADESVQISLGRSLTEGDDDAIGADHAVLRKNGWKRHLTVPAATWFTSDVRPERFAADGHGFLWRRRFMDDAIWDEAASYTHLGSWYVCLHLAAGGQIAIVRDAVIRVPRRTGIGSALLSKADFHHDLGRIVADIGLVWAIPTEARTACVRSLQKLHDIHSDESLSTAIHMQHGPDPLTDRGLHILIVTHGIFPGGAENFPIQLANELIGRGLNVSMLIFKTEDINAEMRATLNPGVSIYAGDWVYEYGCERFIRDIGCSLLHSHGVVGEKFFFQQCDGALPAPYIATLHGSYEASTSTELPESVIQKIVSNVDLFIYTADKNLAPLLRNGVQFDRLVKMLNAMPVDETPFPLTRGEIGIADDAIVFTLVARGIAEKGWSTAIGAFKAVQEKHSDRTMHLCLVGEGDEPERLEPLYANDNSISFLGFQLRIHGLYRITDVAVAPTRFAGESFPLCIIQALQVAVPVVATNIGEIASMLEGDGIAGGLIVENDRRNRLFEMQFAEAMERMIDDDVRKVLSEGAAHLAKRYNMNDLTEQYIHIYQGVVQRFEGERNGSSKEQAYPVHPRSADHPAC